MRVLNGREELVFLAVGFMLSDGLSHAQSAERFHKNAKYYLCLEDCPTQAKHHQNSA